MLQVNTLFLIFYQISFFCDYNNRHVFGTGTENGENSDNGQNVGSGENSDNGEFLAQVQRTNVLELDTSK